MSDFPNKLLTSAFSLLCKCKEQTDLRIKTNETEPYEKYKIAKWTVHLCQQDLHATSQPYGSTFHSNLHFSSNLIPPTYSPNHLHKERHWNQNIDFATEREKESDNKQGHHKHNIKSSEETCSSVYPMTATHHRFEQCNVNCINFHWNCFAHKSHNPSKPTQFAYSESQSVSAPVWSSPIQISHRHLTENPFKTNPYSNNQSALKSTQNKTSAMHMHYAAEETEALAKSQDNKVYWL